MKINSRYYIYGILTLVLAGCKYNRNTETDKGLNSKTELNAEYENPFVYSQSNKKIALILEDKVEFLVVGIPTKAKFETNNINNQRLLIYGPGIAMNSGDDKEFRFVITPIEKTLVNGKLEIQVTERIENGANFTHIFLIPVKKNQNKN